VVLGPNGAGKTTLLQLASGRMHPTSGVVGILGEVLGAVDVFELRPRIGLASRLWPSASRRVSGCETSSSPLPTAWSAAGARPTTRIDEGRADELLEALGASHLANRTSARCRRGSASGSRSLGR
jgi:iron complex transport system ATP-binding protein